MPSRPAASRGHQSSGLVFATTWIAGVLGAAASILFGIWAPLSYKAAADANRDSNTVQSSMVSSLSVANSVAWAALSAANAQASLLQDMQNRFGAMGQLALFQFCANQTLKISTASPCSTFLANVPLPSLISYLGSPKAPSSTAFASVSVSASISSTALKSYSPTPTTNVTVPMSSPRPSPHLTTAAKIAISTGCVFGGLSIISLVLGIFVRRRELGYLLRTGR